MAAKIFSIRVIMNFELERELLGFGAKMRVLWPRVLVKQIKEQWQKRWSATIGKIQR
jgi:predicted DNA-binding transcriptional regulator YafY